MEKLSYYQILVRGQLRPEWSGWFDEMDLEATPDGCTWIRGTVADQAALHGLLAKIRDLNLGLVSLSGEVAVKGSGREEDGITR